MPFRPTRVASLAALALFLCTSCSQREGRGSSQNVAEADTSEPPNISPATAPGVALDYGYEFSLPDQRISATQEAHASACEKLGLAQCRITGMSYSVDQDEQVTAELDLKLDPQIARQFGKSAQQLVEGNDGKLIRLDIGSSDEGEAISQATKQRSSISAQIQQLQAELAKTKPGTQARADLMSQIQALQEQASEQTGAIERSQAALASTPMKFQYYGRGGVPGFRGNPFHAAWSTLATTIVWLVNILLQALAVLVPIAILLAVFIALWRTRPMRAFRRWAKGSGEAEA